jgi:hypothetical protein
MDFSVDVLQTAFIPDEAKLTIPLARALRRLRFTEAQSQEIDRLLTRNNRGTITPKQKERLEGYVRAGELMGILRAKAELRLRQQS